MGFALQQSDSGYLLLGFSQQRAGCEPASCPRRVTTRWELGWRQDLAQGPLVPWLRVVAVIPRVERVATPDGSRTDSGTGWGAEAGGGVRVALGGRLHLAPGVRLGWGGAPVEGRERSLPLRWSAAEVTLVLTF
jgi:hypothetical protein